MYKATTTLLLVLLSALVVGVEDIESKKVEHNSPSHLTSIKSIEQNAAPDTLGNIIKKYHLGKSVLIEKPDRGSDVSLVEITISLSIQRNSHFICAAGKDYVVICRSLKGGIISDIYSTSNIIIHDNKFCENDNLCASQDNK